MPPVPTLTQASPPATPPPADPGDGGRTSPWVWVAGVLGLVILVLAGLLFFRVLAASSLPAATPGPGSVTLPSFVNASYADANAQANRLGIILAPTYVKQNNVLDGTIVGQDPPAGTSVSEGSTVKVNVVSGKDLVSVPSIVGLTESGAIQAIVSANLQLGTRSVDFDPAIPAGSIISQGLPSGPVGSRPTRRSTTSSPRGRSRPPARHRCRARPCRPLRSHRRCRASRPPGNRARPPRRRSCR